MHWLGLLVEFSKEEVKYFYLVKRTDDLIFCNGLSLAHVSIGTKNESNQSFLNSSYHLVIEHFS